MGQKEMEAENKKSWRRRLGFGKFLGSYQDEVLSGPDEICAHLLIYAPAMTNLHHMRPVAWEATLRIPNRGGGHLIFDMPYSVAEIEGAVEWARGILDPTTPGIPTIVKLVHEEIRDRIRIFDVEVQVPVERKLVLTKASEQEKSGDTEIKEES